MFFNTSPLSKRNGHLRFCKNVKKRIQYSTAYVSFQSCVLLFVFFSFLPWRWQFLFDLWDWMSIWYLSSLFFRPFNIKTSLIYTKSGIRQLFSIRLMCTSFWFCHLIKNFPTEFSLEFGIFAILHFIICFCSSTKMWWFMVTLRNGPRRPKFMYKHFFLIDWHFQFN